MKVGIFTPRSLHPLHPRLMAYQSYFETEKIDFQIHSFTQQTSKEFSIANWLSLWFFDWNAVNKCKSLVPQYDIILVNDMKYLPLVGFAHGLGKKVIYETIDHNVYLRFHQLKKRFPVVRFLKKLIISHFERREKKFADKYCHEVIVNSDALHEYLGKKSIVLYFSSPLQGVGTLNNPENPTALLYLGAFTTDKGALETILVAKKLKLQLYVLGSVHETKVMKAIQAPGIDHTSNLSIEELKLRLKELLGKHFLIGLSLIEPVHYSYEVQEANKDIDYLALGIPIIGNTRKPTADKISKGCGWFFSDANLSDKIKNKEEIKQISDRCIEVYDIYYANKRFNDKLKDCWNRLVGLTPTLKK